MINLFTSYFKSTNPDREIEFHHCLYMNIMNPLINNIFLFCENEIHTYLSGHKKLSIINYKRPTYSDFISYINNTEDFNNSYNIISNSDIYFDLTINLVNDIDMNNTCVSLTRWDVDNEFKETFFNRNDSQDCWIFKGNIKEELIPKSEFYFGVPGCDNVFMNNLCEEKYWSINPSKSIKSLHFHISKVRTSTKKNKLVGDYMYLNFCNIEDIFLNKERKNYYTKNKVK